MMLFRCRASAAAVITLAKVATSLKIASHDKIRCFPILFSAGISQPGTRHAIHDNFYHILPKYYRELALRNHFAIFLVLCTQKNTVFYRQPCQKYGSAILQPSLHIGESLDSLGEVLDSLVSIAMFYAVSDAVLYMPLQHHLPRLVQG